jgi:hypothetical protein
LPQHKFPWFDFLNGVAFLGVAILLLHLHDYAPAAVSALGAVLMLGSTLRELL